jgi:hypothetical protein
MLEVAVAVFTLLVVQVVQAALAAVVMVAH